MIENRHIQHAIALAQHRNFARAASELGISQPALTRSIQVLETKLGVRLFDRFPRDIIPTSFGSTFIERGEEILSATKQLRREIDLMRGLEVGELSVGATPFVSQVLVGPAAGRLAAQYPSLKLNIQVESWENLSRKLYTGKLDLFVGELANAEEQETLQYRDLSHHEVTFYCRSGHPLLSNHSVNLAQVCEYSFVLSDPMLSRLGPELEKDDGPLAPLSGMIASGEHLSCNDAGVAQHIVAHSDAISICHPLLIDSEITKGHLAALPMENVSIQSHIGIAYPIHRSLSPAAEEFVEQITSLDQEWSRRHCN